MPQTNDHMDEQLTAASSINEVIELCRENRNELVSVKKALNELLDHYQITIPEFIKKCGFSRSNKLVPGWFDGTSEPRGRSQYLKIAIGLGMNLNETDQLLRNVAGTRILYPKNTRDAAYMHTILTNGNYAEFLSTCEMIEYEMDQCVFEETVDRLPEDYVNRRREILKAGGECCREELDKLDAEYDKLLRRVRSALRKELIEGPYYIIPTHNMLRLLSEDTNMSGYVRLHWREILTQNWLLSEHINKLLKKLSYIKYSALDQVDTVGHLVVAANADEFISEKAGYIIKKEYSELCNKGKTPSRSVIIMLGLLLGQDVNGINLMLRITGMDHLCACRGVEAALIFALNRYSKEDPAEKLSKINRDLITYAKKSGDEVSDLVELIFDENEIYHDLV